MSLDNNKPFICLGTGASPELAVIKCASNYTNEVIKLPEGSEITGLTHSLTRNEGAEKADRWVFIMTGMVYRP